ncbi:MAG TPA: acyl-CoA carboxylase subunit beta [Polyangia bacterium]|jgi:acetyl-CoA carboxylase carboxyltransferase component
MLESDKIRAIVTEIKKGGPEKYHRQNAQAGKLFVRDRLRLLLDDGGEDFAEDGLLARAEEQGFPADGIVTGVGRIGGRPVAIAANDSTVKAGSWGTATVEKIIRIQETAARLRMPLVYLVDSAGARITEQIEMFPGRRHAGFIFHNQVRLSGFVPQVCLLLGPSAAGGAYIPAFCDVVAMVEGNASMYLGSPRMAEAVIGEKATLEEMGGARMHCEQSGCGDVLVQSEEEGLAFVRRYLSYLPSHAGELPPVTLPRATRVGGRSIDEVLPTKQSKSFDMYEVIDTIIDEDSFLEIKRGFARELITGFARLEGRPVGIVASQPKHKGGVLFGDSADKGARFIWLCDAFNVPLLFLADVPGFMIGTQVERRGIIRHGAKMISAVSEATVPKISVILRKAYGAGLYAMCGPGFEPDACLALPQAMIAVMGPEAAVNAVYANQIAAKPEAERPGFIAELREEYVREIDVLRLASRLHIDAVVPGDQLRHELNRRFAASEGKRVAALPKKRSVTPV